MPKPLTLHRDDRGFLVELFKGDWAGGQITLVEAAPGVRRGGHKHPNTDEKWIVIRGEGVMRLETPDGIRQMFPVRGDQMMVVPLPPGTGHEIENTGKGPLWLLYWADKQYDPANIDEEKWSWE